MQYAFRFDVIWDKLGDLLSGFGTTLQLTAAAILLSTLLAVGITFVRRRQLRIVNRIIAVYIEIMRNVPLLVLLYFVYFGLGEIGWNFSSWTAVTLALVFCNGAYLAEVMRAGIEAIPPSQNEAGLSLGLHDYQVFLRIILPQALRSMIPSLMNQYIIILLSSSFASLVAIDELTSTVSRLSSFSFRTFEFYAAGAVLYLISTMALMLLSKIFIRKKR